jgi:hypothetical protein
MPVCPECYLGVPSSFLNCPDCGGDLRLREIEIELEPLPDAVNEIEILEPEPEPEPAPAPEPEPAPVPSNRPPKTEQKKRSRTKPKSRHGERRPAATVVRLAVVPEAERPAQTEPEPEPLPAFGELIGVLEEVAGFGQRSSTVAFHEDAVVAANEVVPLDAIESASLTKIRFELYRELTLTLKNGSIRTLRWLPEYNDDLETVPLLREALGERLTSFSRTAKAGG